MQNEDNKKELKEEELIKDIKSNKYTTVIYGRVGSKKQ